MLDVVVSLATGPRAAGLGSQAAHLDIHRRRRLLAHMKPPGSLPFTAKHPAPAHLLGQDTRQIRRLDSDEVGPKAAPKIGYDHMFVRLELINGM